MKTISVNTNLHCDVCVDKISKKLKSDSRVTDWKVDLKTVNPPLTVSGEDISETFIEDILNSEGYKVVRENHQQEKGFWSDLKIWKRASFNTLSCLIGCSIGDFGMVIFLQHFYPETHMMWQMVLAIIAGLATSIMLETVLMKIREGFDWKLAFQTAIGMSFISMVAMELAMTSTDFMITGGKAAFGDPMYWLALVPALIVGFLTPLPYNYYKLRKFNKSCH